MHLKTENNCPLSASVLYFDGSIFWPAECVFDSQLVKCLCSQEPALNVLNARFQISVCVISPAQ